VTRERRGSDQPGESHRCLDKPGLPNDLYVAISGFDLPGRPPISNNDEQRTSAQGYDGGGNVFPRWSIKQQKRTPTDRRSIDSKFGRGVALALQTLGCLTQNAIESLRE